MSAPHGALLPRDADDLTRLVADWAERSATHSQRLRDTARRNPMLLHRVVYNLLRSGGGPDSTIHRLSNALTKHDLDYVDWHAVAARLVGPRRAYRVNPDLRARHR